MRHGQDGGGSDVGKSMNVPDLRSPAVQMAAGRGTCSSHCQWQGRNALIQEFAQRGSDSLDGFLRSLAASKEIGRTLYPAVVATGNGFSSFGREAVEKGGSSWITRKISHAKKMLVIQIPRKIRELMTP